MVLFGFQLDFTDRYCFGILDLDHVPGLFADFFQRVDCFHCARQRHQAGLKEGLNIGGLQLRANALQTNLQFTRRTGVYFGQIRNHARADFDQPLFLLDRVPPAFRYRAAARPCALLES